MSGQGGCFALIIKNILKAKLLSHHGMDKINFKNFTGQKRLATSITGQIYKLLWLMPKLVG